ncbi:secretion system protein [Calidifontibacter sp. DB0510]|uniref:Secretion system protein n=1 Tax=Metallococcus carri TaxID=1656884 RepID=A0A967B0Y9_9MICO|nr:type II secretion system F family protein [Metallococcus carri]NHN55400.1 secretion system protein [Metallococcus carri]NOP36477.1 secretion system protein [Calidifontibacter sp. DB2511S]
MTTAEVTTTAAPRTVGDAPAGPETVLDVAVAIDLIAIGLSGGAALVDAVAAVAEVSGPVIGSHLRQVVAALRWGVLGAAAWADLPEVWQRAAAALVLAEEAGVPPRDLLHDAADALRADEAARQEAAAARLGVALVIPLGLFFLPAFGLLAVVPVIAALARDVLSGVT